MQQRTKSQTVIPTTAEVSYVNSLHVKCRKISENAMSMGNVSKLNPNANKRLQMSFS